MGAKQDQNKKVVTALIGNEVLLQAAKKSLQDMGYSVLTNIESCADADFAMIDSYFLWLGVVKQVCALNPSLPLVLLATPPYDLNGDSRHFFGVIELNGNSEMDAREKISKWFTEGQGKFLIKKKGK